MDCVCNEISATSYIFGLWTLRHDGVLFYDGKRLYLPPKELQLLRVLLGSAGMMISKDRLLDCVWPDAEVAEQSLTRCIYSLRKLLGSSKNFIKTIYGRGYCFSFDGVRLVSSSQGSRSQKAQSLLVLPFVVSVGGRNWHREIVHSLASVCGSNLQVMPAALAGGGFSGGDHFDLIRRLQPDYYLSVSNVSCSGDLELSVELVRSSNHSLVYSTSLMLSVECVDVVGLLAEAISKRLQKLNPLKAQTGQREQLRGDFGGLPGERCVLRANWDLNIDGFAENAKICNVY